jgi:hypothetical protein
VIFIPDTTSSTKASACLQLLAATDPDPSIMKQTSRLASHDLIVGAAVGADVGDAVVGATVKRVSMYTLTSSSSVQPHLTAHEGSGWWRWNMVVVGAVVGDEISGPSKFYDIRVTTTAA